MFSVVIVTHDSAGVLETAIRSVPPGHEIVVVDNASGDRSVEIARSLGARVVELAENTGYGGGCNRGAAVATGERLLFLNPDARLEEDALDHLARAFERYPGSAAFNPRILKLDGSRFFRRRTKLLPRPYLRHPDPPESDRRVHVLVGAALAARRSVFEEIGGFDDRIFLYYEDEDLSARLVRAGHGLHYVHDAVVHHAGGASTAPSPQLDRLKEYHKMKAARYVFRKHGSPLWRPVRIVEEAVRAALSNRDSASSVRARARLEALLE